jgi:hypothetical protein
MRPVDKDDFDLALKSRGAVAENKQTPRPDNTHRPFTEADAQECLDYYEAQYEKGYGLKPVYTRCYNEAKTVMKDTLRKCRGDKSLVKRMIDIYLGDTNKYFRDRKHTLDVFAKNTQELAAAASLARKQSSTQQQGPMLRICVQTRCYRCGVSLEIICGGTQSEIETASCSRCREK